jgi:hypothetical protein
MGLIVRPETSLRFYHYSLRNNTEQSSSLPQMFSVMHMATKIVCRVSLVVYYDYASVHYIQSTLFAGKTDMV